MLILVIGDLNIPNKAIELDPKFKKLFVPGKIQHILATGNLTCPSVLQYLSTVAPQVSIVSGVWDQMSCKDTHILNIGDLVIGLYAQPIIGGTKAYSALARKLNVDVLITGGLEFRAYELHSRFYLCPGSATLGTFCLLDINQSSLVCYIYKIEDNDIKVDKMEFNK